MLTAPYDEEYLAVCPVRAVERLVAVGKGIGWDMTSGFLFSDISSGSDGKLRRGALAVATAKISSAIKRYAQVAGETQDFSLHS